MDWFSAYESNRQPTPAEISAFIANPLWEELNAFLRESYDVASSYSYSGCSGQPGWNVKYQKAGKSLCTLYPMEGFFIALVVIGTKEEAEAELLKPMLTEQVRQLFAGPAHSMGRWLMIHVTNEQALADVKQLIQVRRKIKKPAKKKN
jgi:hypothetical protein